MLLTVDIGNTNITLGVFEGKKLHVTFRMTTIQTRTSDEYGMVMCELLEHNDVKVEEITDVIVASVVPNVMHSLTSAIIKYFHTKPIIIEAGVKTGIRVASKNPRQVGADRIVDAAAVYELYGGPAIVIDYGTATTFDLVDADGTFTACVIAPGIRTSAQAMWSMAAKLPEFEIKKPNLRPHQISVSVYLLRLPCTVHTSVSVHPESPVVFSENQDSDNIFLYMHWIHTAQLLPGSYLVVFSFYCYT